MKTFPRFALNAAVVCAVALLISGCGASLKALGSGEAATHEQGQPAPREYQALWVSVLDNGVDGPQLCYAMKTSLPPQCGGPAVNGWDWSKVEHEEANGVRWGDYNLVGMWENNEFTLTREPTSASDPEAYEAPDFTTPCRSVEAIGHATDEDLEVAATLADELPGVADVWLDQNVTPEQVTELNANDPNRIILNVSTTGDLGEAEAAIRSLWPGHLCVSKASRSTRELEQIRHDVHEMVGDAGLLLTSSDLGFGRVNISLWFDVDGAIQKRVDEKYGEGIVLVSSHLTPVNTESSSRD